MSPSEFTGNLSDIFGEPLGPTAESEKSGALVWSLDGGIRLEVFEEAGRQGPSPESTLVITAG